VTIDESVVVPMSAEETFEWLTDPDRLRRRQGITARGDVQAGGAYRHVITPAHPAVGTFIEVGPGKRFTYTPFTGRVF
jgi:uncharacterized protein YndB with AHSA1/START domain